MMRIAEVGPHEERPIRGPLVEDRSDLSGDLVVGTRIEKIDAVGKRAEMMFGKQFFDFAAGSARRRTVQMERASANAREVAGFLAKQFRERNYIAGQRR